MGNISKIKDFDPSSFPLYFLDANVWIAILKYNQSNKAEKRFQPYIDFFEAIIHLNSISDPKVLKKVKYQPKIVFTSMLLSEIINAYLRRVAMPAFLNNNPGDFKKDYRENIYSDYDKQLKIIINDLQAYSFVYEYIDDNFIALNPMDLLNSISRKVDFNDLYYMSLMEKYSVPIITHDKDFSINNVIVVTDNNTLLQLR